MCSVGILEKCVARNAFQIVSDTVDFSISRDKMVSPREAVRLISLANGQGFIVNVKPGVASLNAIL